MKDGFLRAAAVSPALRVADCACNAQQIIAAMREYDVKDVQLLGGTHGLPEALAIALLLALQLTLRNALITIGVSTVFYMLLVQKIFI